MKKKKKKLNKKRTLVFILFIYIICYFLYDLVNSPIKHYEINGNNLVKDSDILKVSNLKDYPSIMKYTSNTIKKKIKSIELINDVKVRKWFGHKVIINVEENKVLFYYKDIGKIVLSNGNIINNKYSDLVGIPIMLNDIDKDVYNMFISGFSKINDNIIYEINNIEYYPQYDVDGNVISKDRFKIVMNDGNTIIVNSKSVDVLNKYNDIYASLNDKKGTINLDSNKLDNLVFIPYEG